MNDFEGFIDQLIKDKGLDSETPEVLAQIKEDLSSSLEERVNALIITNLDPEKFSDFEIILNNDNQEEINNFIKANIENIDEKVAAELLQFRRLYIS